MIVLRNLTKNNLMPTLDREVEFTIDGKPVKQRSFYIGSDYVTVPDVVLEHKMVKDYIGSNMISVVNKRSVLKKMEPKLKKLGSIEKSDKVEQIPKIKPESKKIENKNKPLKNTNK